MRERELKLAIGDTFVLPDLADPDLGIGEMRPLAPLDLRSVYHDTADLRLARHGLTLRYRIGEKGAPGWTLKLPVGGVDATEREELGFEGAPGEVPAQALALVAVWVRHEHLAPAAAMTTRRRRWLLSDIAGGPVAELDLDDVSVLDGERVVARFREMELESRGAALEGLAPIVHRLQQAGAVPAAPVPKAVRALGPRATAGPDVVVPRRSEVATVGDVVRAAIAAGVIRLRANDAPARLTDEEGVHQMRVATRRLRSDLRTFAAVLDEVWASGLSEELRWLGGLLGAVRDADVELASLRLDAADLSPAIDRLTDAIAERRHRDRTALLEALAGSRYVDLIDRLVQAANAPLLRDESPGDLAAPLEGMLRLPIERLQRRAQQTPPNAPEPALHRVRIAAKRARYTAEAIGPYVAHSRRLGKVARTSARLQNDLGRLQDAVVLVADLEATLAAREGDSAFALAAGRLIERQESVKRQVRRAYRKDRAASGKAIEKWARAS